MPAWRVYALALLLAFATASLGGAVTDLGEWYRSLDQPDWKPADRWFGPVWTTIFLLIAVSGAMAWRGADSASERRQVLFVYALNGLLNVTWSFLFFFLHRPDWAVLEVGVLWLSIVAMQWVAWRASRLAAVLLAPYLLWVSFAAVLNFAVVQRNAPFGG